MEASDDSAAAKVFAVPELLENILLYLPFSRLFTFQRVNSTFKGVIEGSIAIRRRMFLEPTQVYDVDEANQLLSDEPLRQATYPFMFRLCYDGEAGIAPLFIDSELSCSWMSRNQSGNGEELFYSRSVSDSNKSWHAIRMPLDERGLDVAISCEETYWNDRGLLPCHPCTLGSVVNQAREMACKVWEASCSVQCATTHHLGPVIG